MSVPKNFDRVFLEWFRSRTEQAWARRPRTDGEGWQTATRWTRPLGEAEISAAEKKWDLAFPPDYKLFLGVLHTTDLPPRQRKWKGTAGDSELVETVGFPNWLGDDGVIRERLARPLEGLEFDVERNELWLKEWGEKPSAVESRKRKLRAEFQKAPRLIPVIGHRYLLAQPCESGNPVLSVYQSDIVTYGSDLRSYLLNEFADEVGLTKEELEQERRLVTEKNRLARIPFWGPVGADADS